MTMMTTTTTTMTRRRRRRSRLSLIFPLHHRLLFLLLRHCHHFLPLLLSPLSNPPTKPRRVEVVAGGARAAVGVAQRRAQTCRRAFPPRSLLYRRSLGRPLDPRW
jgi:hypothetical protein